MGLKLYSEVTLFISIDFNETNIASVIAAWTPALILTLGLTRT